MFNPPYSCKEFQLLLNLPLEYLCLPSPMDQPICYWFPYYHYYRYYYDYGRNVSDCHLQFFALAGKRSFGVLISNRRPNRFWQKSRWMLLWSCICRIPTQPFCSPMGKCDGNYANLHRKQGWTQFCFPLDWLSWKRRTIIIIMHESTLHNLMSLHALQCKKEMRKKNSLGKFTNSFIKISFWKKVLKKLFSLQYLSINCLICNQYKKFPIPIDFTLW